ncbi:hypothetical protein C2845_PM17G09160 [Panicum miliaceum]|uniref:RNase H type-1 domain-containing protein n=1 Tax=Panicum miliaceum TaxID=4540 RepID=A0A3L6Q2V3_PANMI|nr:hypothetical protein C2845_PM17G09160 [Panicum miliaceum]
MLEDLICSDSVGSVSSAGDPGRWQRPPVGWMKINTDAAYTAANGRGATGVVLRNDQGVVLVGAARAYSNVADVMMAEVMGARDGVLLALEQGATKVLLETDNATLISLLNSDDGIQSVIVGFWHEVRELSLSFVSFACIHVKREGNEAAHLCACMPSASCPELSWFEPFPNWLKEATNKDCDGVMI